MALNSLGAHLALARGAREQGYIRPDGAREISVTQLGRMQGRVHVVL